MSESYADATARRGHPPILVLGRDSCEDTTAAREHLTARGVPFEYHHVDEDPVADAHIRRLNDGHWVTPTILFGNPDAPYRILREPSNDDLDEALLG
jgi:glutaredoxin